MSAVAVAADEAGPRRRRFDLAGWGLALYAFALPIVFTTSGISYLLVPKVALSLVIVGPGLVALGRLAVRGDMAARWGLGFLLVAGLSTLFSDVPALSVFGGYAMFNGWLLFGVCLGVWALGRCAAGRENTIALALIFGTLVNAALAWLEALWDLRNVWVGFDYVDGRPFAFMANPVHLGAACAAALWLVLRRDATRDRATPWLLAVALIVGAANLSGSRISLVLAVAMVLGFVVWLGRRRRWLHALALVALAGAGFGLSVLPTVSAESGSTRVASTSGISSRIEVWTHGVEAAVDRPLLGWGPGRSYQATTPLRSVEAARAEGPEIIFRDMHNFVVEVLVSTGFVGLIAFGGWLVGACRRARGPLVGYAAVGAIVLLVQPALLLFAPLVTLALGVAGADDAERVGSDLGMRNAPRLRALSAVLLVAGIGAGAVLLVGDSGYYNAIVNRDIAPLHRWTTRLMPWPELEVVRAQLWEIQASIQHGGIGGKRSLESMRDAVARDPYDPRTLLALGIVEQKYGSRAAARRDYERAVAVNPWGVHALRNLLALAAQDHDRAAVRRYRRVLCSMGKTWCPTQALIDAAARAGTATGG